MVSFILNPLAGDRRGLKLLEQLQRALEQRRVEAEVLKTIAPGDGVHLAAVALKRGVDHVVAVGGDGTISEVLASIVGQDATLGIVPIGSTNSIARSLGLPEDWEAALGVALTGTPRPVDVGMAGDRPFLGAAVLGLEDVEEASSRSFGRMISGRSTTSTLPLDLLVDGQLELRVPAHRLVVGNLAARSGDQQGPWVSDDGLLEVYVSDPQETTHLRARTVELRGPSDLALQLDGELRRASAPLVLRLAPARQTVLVGA